MAVSSARTLRLTPQHPLDYFLALDWLILCSLESWLLLGLLLPYIIDFLVSLLIWLFRSWVSELRAVYFRFWPFFSTLRFCAFFSTLACPLRCCHPLVFFASLLWFSRCVDPPFLLSTARFFAFVVIRRLLHPLPLQAPLVSPRSTPGAWCHPTDKLSSLEARRGHIRARPVCIECYHRWVSHKFSCSWPVEAEFYRVDSFIGRVVELNSTVRVVRNYAGISWKPCSG